MDQESRDANSLLVELDKGLKSSNIGDQSESVVRFTNLFQKYPLPLIINSAFLKLAEAFRCVPNFIRVLICEVFEQNQVHLNKIYSIEDFFRNIFTVTTSNDPIARSISLIALGNISPIVADHKSIHHYISSSLESTIKCELSATITCAASYVKLSSEFACNIYPKIISMIESERTPTEVKIKALSVLDHGFYNAHDAMIVRSFLINVITKSQLKKLIVTCLGLSTKIAYTSLTHIVPQIELLIRTFSEDGRPQVRLSAITNLKFLAEKSPHIWETQHVIPLVNYLESNLDNKQSIDENDESLTIILSIFCKLLTCKCNFVSQPEKTRIFQNSYKLVINHSNESLYSTAFELLTVMSDENINNLECQSSNLTSDTLNAIKTFLVNHIMCHSKSKKDLKNIQQLDQNISSSSIKKIYKFITKLCQMNPQFCPELLELILTKISTKNILLRDISPYTTVFLCTIIQSTDALSDTPDNCWKILKSNSSELSEANLLNMCVFCFQRASQDLIQKIWKAFMDKVIANNSVPFGLKVMRQAMRFGHFTVADLICNELDDKVNDVNIDFYFKSLAKICEAESILANSDTTLDMNLKTALPIYEESLSPLRASIGTSRATDFQLEFLLLRVRLLRAHCSLRLYCQNFESTPFTYTELLNAINSSKNFESRSAIYQQIPKTLGEFRNLSDCYENLSLMSSNCDNDTLDYLYLLKSSCTIMADLIESIFYYGNNLTVLSKLSTSLTNGDRPLEHRGLGKTCIKLMEMLKIELIQPGILPSDEPVERLISLLRRFSDELLKCPFIYPRYFAPAGNVVAYAYTNDINQDILIAAY